MLLVSSGYTLAITARAASLLLFLILKSIGSSVYTNECKRMAHIYNGIWHPAIIIQYQSFVSADSVYGIANDKTATSIKLKFIIMFVEVPKPLSIN